MSTHLDGVPLALAALVHLELLQESLCRLDLGSDPPDPRNGLVNVEPRLLGHEVRSDEGSRTRDTRLAVDQHAVSVVERGANEACHGREVLYEVGGGSIVDWDAEDVEISVIVVPH